MTIELIVSNGEKSELMAILEDACLEEMDGTISINAPGPFSYEFELADVVSDLPADDCDECEYVLRDGRVITITYL